MALEALKHDASYCMKFLAGRSRLADDLSHMLEAARLAREYVENTPAGDINAQDNRGQTALPGAALFGYDGVNKDLMAHNVNVNINAKDSKDTTPLDFSDGTRRRSRSRRHEQRSARGDGRPDQAIPGGCASGASASERHNSRPNQ